ncbi:uncharacterized protein LOC130731820 isoform X2 [Lotus japonicus]|uniref:uncharacterized protein LOC130731820 isoform X2 n=2 Tax=Lotus japonicus TaxID=34305 RepID=UPI00258E64AC|nr:uncharacterized protein LOC130731820 isoform X2 [Lotus japonicus]
MDPNNMADLDIYDVVIDELINDTTIEDMMQEEMEFYQRRANTVRPKRTRKVIERDREAGNERLWNDYFSENPVYTEELFRRRFRMRKHVFLRIVGALGSHDPYFLMSVDAVGRQGLSPLQKCTAAIRMLAYGSPADSVDEYVRIGESTAIECLKNFVEGVCAVFGETYLRRPNQEDITRLLQWGESRGFPGSNNDINVLNQSPVFNEVLSGNAPMVNFSVNGTMYNMGYYLADGIYPPWATFVKTIPMPQGEKRQKFAKRQEGARKDVERAFGVLQSRFAIVRGPSRFWHPNEMKSIMYACIILHNMCVEDERNTYRGNFVYDQVNNDILDAEVVSGPIPAFRNILERRAHQIDRSIHHQLQADLVEHIWQLPENENNEN